MTSGPAVAAVVEGVAVAVAVVAAVAGPPAVAVGDPPVRDPAVVLRAVGARAAWRRALRQCRGRQVRTFVDRAADPVIELPAVRRWATCRRPAVGPAVRWAIGPAVETLQAGPALASVIGPEEETSPIVQARVRVRASVRAELPATDQAPARAHHSGTCRIFLIFPVPEAATSVAVEAAV